MLGACTLKDDGDGARPTLVGLRGEGKDAKSFLGGGGSTAGNSAYPAGKRAAVPSPRDLGRSGGRIAGQGHIPEGTWSR